MGMPFAPARARLRARSKPGTGAPATTPATTPATAPATAPDVFRALSDATRLRVLDLLRDGERCVCELEAALDTGQSLLSFHLKTLREAGLVTYRKEGRWAHYRLSDAGLRQAHDVVAAIRQPKHRKLPLKCC